MVDDHGFEFIPFDEKVFEVSEEEPFNAMVGRRFHLEPLKRYKNMSESEKRSILKPMWDILINDLALEKLFDDRKDFDVIICDFFYPLPSIYKSGIPFVPIYSPNPLGLYKADMPLGAGFSGRDIGSPQVQEYLEDCMEWTDPHILRVKNYLKSKGCEELSDSFGAFSYMDQPPYFGLYHYPKDVDYTDLGEIRPNWIRVDSLIRKQAIRDFEVPESISAGSGKLIYFSMGSIASVDHEMMNTLIQMLGRSPHRFIVSTGRNGENLRLYSNMWGKPYLDQIAILPKVDLAIIHGGNNTFVECLYFGKPMIIIPYFFDQLDNGRRAEDTGVGKQLFLWDLTEKKLLDTIEEVLEDEKIKSKVQTVSENIRKSNSIDSVIEKIEALASSKKAC